MWETPGDPEQLCTDIQSSFLVAKQLTKFRSLLFSGRFSIGLKVYDQCVHDVCFLIVESAAAKLSVLPVLLDPG